MKTDSILDKICAQSKIDLEKKKSAIGMSEIMRLAQDAPARASFAKALRKDGITVIAELKKASPSMGVIREDFNYADIAKSYRDGGAAAISVLTEENYFLGSCRYLKEVSELVATPLLRKDFIYDPYQICEAKVYGASAILLIAKMLSKKEFSELNAFAKSLGLDVLSEAHDESELDMLLECGADIVGVNCRNLKTFDTDFQTSLTLIEKIPTSAIRVCESAVKNSQMLKDARSAGADAALIGTALMSSANPGGKLAELLEGAK